MMANGFTSKQHTNCSTYGEMMKLTRMNNTSKQLVATHWINIMRITSSLANVFDGQYDSSTNDRWTFFSSFFHVLCISAEIWIGQVIFGAVWLNVKLACTDQNTNM